MSKCQECIFYREVLFQGQIKKIEICAKNPPVFFPMQSQQGMAVQGMQPPIPAAGWCGEFEENMMREV